MDIVLGLIYYMIIAWLILKSPRYFHRSEIGRTYKPRDDFESGYNPEYVIKYYKNHYMSGKMGYQLLDYKEGREVFLVYHKILNSAPLLEYATTDNFFKKKSAKNIAHTLKMLGFCHLVFHSGAEVNVMPKYVHRYRRTWLRRSLAKSSFLSFTRWLFTALSLFTVLIAVMTGDFIFTIEFLPFVLLLTLIFYVLYFFMEVWLYFRQNRFSVKLGESMDFDGREMDFVRHYLRNSLFRFIILQLFIIIFIFVLIIWLLIAFNA